MIQCAHQPALPRVTQCSAVEQLVEVSQTRAIADALLRLRRQLGEGGAAARGRSLAQLLDLLEAEMDERVGLEGARGLCATERGGSGVGRAAEDAAGA